VSLARPGCFPIAQSPTPNSYLKERDRSRPLMFLATASESRTLVKPRSLSFPLNELTLRIVLLKIGPECGDLYEELLIVSDLDNVRAQVLLSNFSRRRSTSAVLSIQGEATSCTSLGNKGTSSTEERCSSRSQKTARRDSASHYLRRARRRWEQY
jgi:hypothetical protein